MSGEGAQRLALALVLLVSLLAPLVTAAPLSETTEMDVYDGEAGCYYNFQHYGEGDRIMTNEPCLNCTCHNRMLMCYLRVCPFTKPIGQDCTVEKRGDQCCPVITCPDVPVDLLTSTTQSPVDSTEVGHHDNYGCSIDDKFYSDGAQVPSNSNKPCELCYCIRNMTTCVMQECTLHVEGCTPVYNRGVCCPVRYSCDHPDEDGPLMIDDMTTTVKPTPGFMLTTTLAPGFTMECTHDDEVYADGALITTDKACEHCYCMKGDIVCIVQGCGTPMENEGKNCTAVAPKADQCCPETYVCDGDESPTTSMGDANVLTTTHSPKDEELEVQKPEVEGDTEKHKPESEHTTEADSATDKQKPESSTNIPQTDSITITESEKATPYVTEQDQLEIESSTEHVPKLGTSAESSTPHVETETVHDKPESDTSTDTQKVEAESATDKQKPDSESITDKHNLESESATDKHESDLESVTDKHILSPESATDKHTPESATDKQKPDSESVTDKGEPESTTDKQEQGLQSITDKQEPDSESVTDKLRPESATDKQDSDLESVTDKHKPELESVTDKQAPDSESVTDKQGQDLESTTHKEEQESVTDKHRPESATDKQDSESVTDKHKPKLESATDKQVPDLESVTDKQEPDSESVTDKHRPESATDKQDSETVTDKHESELEPVTDKQSPDSESATDKQEPDSESVTDKHQLESATDKQESDLESVTDKHKPELVSTTESKKPSSQDSTEKVKSDSVDTTTEKQHIESDGYTEKTSGLEITTQIPRVEGATEAHEPSLEIDQSTQTLEYESVTKTKGPELEISTIKQDLETEHTPTRKPEHDEHTTIKQSSDEDSVTDKKTPELDNEIEEDKTGLGDRLDEHIPESDSTTEVQKLEPEQATENLIPETVTSAEKQKPESDSQLEQKPETGHKNATSKPKLDDDIEHKPALDKIDEKPQLELDHDKKTELGQEVSKKPDSEEEDDGQKLETDEESGEQKPAVEQDSVEQIVELEYGTKPSIEHGTKAHTPQPEDEITTHSLEIDEQKHIPESTTEFEKLYMDNIHKPQTPQITDEDKQHTGQKDDAHKAEESTEDQSSEGYTHKPHLEDRTTIASDDQILLTTVPSIISEIEEKTTVQPSDIEHVTETNVPRVTKISDADEQTIAEGIETVTPVRDYKDDDITDENVPKHDAATKVPQHRDEHEPEYTPTDKDQSFEGTTKTSLVTDKTISATEIIDTDDKIITTENVLEEGHVDETLPLVTDSIESQVTTVKYQQTEEELTTIYDEKISKTEKPHKQDVGLATDLPSITEKESSSKLPLDSATETYQTTTHKDLYDTKGDTTDESEVEKTTHHPDSQEKEKLPHDVTEEIESELPTTVDGSDVVHRVTESSLDIGHEGSGSESPEITDEKISESSTKTPIFTPTSSDVTEGPKDTETDYTKYPIIDSYSEIPDSHTEVSKDKTPTTVASSQTTKSSITDESPEIESQTLDSQQIDDVFSFTTVQPISDSTDSIHDRYQTDRTDTDNETDKKIESVTKLSTGEKDIKTDDLTTIKSDLVHPTKDHIITTFPSIDQHEEGSGDESTTMNTYESESHTTEKTHVPEISESVSEKEDQKHSLTTEEPISTMKDISHHDDGEGTTEKTTVTSSLQTETIKPEHDDKADSSTTDKPLDTVTHVHEELTEKPDKLHDEQDSTTPIVHTKLEGDELENEIDEDDRYPEQDHEPPRIPGEGDCLVDGITYRNNSPIPTANKCQSSCQCVNSILKCDHVQCSPPPADMVNCQPVYHAKDNCCPMYTCEHIEPVTIESDNHMADVTTLAPQETTILSTYTTQFSKDHASGADQDTESHAVDRFQTDKPEDDVSQSTQSPKGSDEQKIIPVFITTDDSKPQEDKDEVHETPIVPSIHIPDCGSNGCSPESKPTSDKPEIGQVTENSKLDMPETTKKPVGGESTEKDGTLVQPTTVIYDQKTDGDYEQKPISVDIPLDATDTPSTTSPHKEDITHQTSIADEETTTVSKAVRDDLTTVQPETSDDKIDLEDDIAQNTIQPEEDSLLTTTPKFIHSEQTTEKIHLESPGLEEKPIEDSEGTTISPSQDSQESDDTSSEVDADDKKDTTDEPISHGTTEGLLSTKYSGSGYEYSTPINKLLIDDPEITFISTTSKSTETEFTTMVGPFEQKTEHPLDTETETEKIPSVDTSQQLDSDMKTSVKPEIGIDLEEIDEHKEQITTVAYNQEKELTTELSDKKKIPTTELEETVEHKTPGYEYTDKPEESDKTDDIHDEVTTIETEIDSTSSPVEHENVSSTEQIYDSSVTDAAISHTDQTTIKYADDSSSTKVPVNIDSRDKLTTISPKEDSDIFTIRPVVTETTNLTKPSSEQPDVEKLTESPVTESDIIQTTTKSNIQPIEEEGDNNIVDTEKETDKPLDIVTDSPVEYTTAKLSEITTTSSDDVNRIGVSVLPTDTVDEDCGPAGCSQKQPHDTVTSHTPIDADSKGDCGLQGCQVEVEFTRVPIEKATVPPTISEECRSEECKLSQTPPKDVDVPTQCGPEGCEHDDQQNIITDEDDKTECGSNGCTPGSKPHLLPSDDSTKKESDKDGQCGPAGCEQSHEIGEPHVTPSDDSTHKESDKDGECGDNGCDLTGSEQPHKPTESPNKSEQCDSLGCTSTKIEQSHEGHPLEPTKESCEGESCSGNQTPKPIDEQQSTSNCKNGVCPSTDDNVIQTDTAQTTVPFADSTPASGDVVTEIPKDHDLQIGDCGPQGCDSEHEKSTKLPEILTGDTDKATTVSTQDCNGEECSSVKTPEKDEKEKSDIEKPTDITPICESGDCEVVEKSTEIPDTEEVTTTVSKTPAISDKPTKPEEASSDEDVTLKSNIDDTASTPTYNLEKTTEKVIGHQEDCNSPDCLEENQTVTSQPLSEAEEQLTTVSHVDVDGHKDVKCDGENCATDRPVISITESTKTPSETQKPLKESTSAPETVKEDELDIKIPVTTEISTHETLSGIDQHETTIKPSQVDSDTEKSIIDERFTEDNKATEIDNEITTLQSPTDDDHITETGPKVEKEPGSDEDKSVENQTTLSPHEPLETKPHIPSTDIPVSLNPDDFAAVTDKDDSVQTTEYSVDIPEKHTLSPESHILEKDSDVTTTSPKDSVQHSTEIASPPLESTDKYPEIENIPVSVDTELPITNKPSITEPGKVTDEQSELMTTESYDQSTLISKHPYTESTTKIDEDHTAHDTHKPEIIDSSKVPEVTDSTHITDVITSTPSSTDLEENLKTTVQQDEIKQSTDASIKDHSLEDVTSTMIPGEESQQPTDKPHTDVEKSTSISPQEEVTGIPVGQSDEHIPQTSEKESIDSTTLKSAEDLEASISHTTETQKPIIKETEISDASTLVPEEKDYTTQSPLHEDHYTKSPEKESETKKPTLPEVSEVDQTSTRIPEDIHESSQHPGQSDVTLKPINESQEDTDQSSEEIEGTDHSSEENEGTDHSSEEIGGTTDSHGERDQMPTTTVKSLLDIIRPTDATEHGIIKTTEKSVDEIATEKDFAGITDKPELTKEPETTEKSIDAIPEHDLEHVSTLKPDEHDTKKPVDTHETVQTTFSPISDDEKEASITESTVQEDKTQKPHDESEITTPLIKDADKDIEVTTHYLDSTTIHKQGDEIHTTPKYPDVHSAYNKTELPHHGEEGSGSTELPHPDVTTVSEITEKHTESLIPSSTIAPIQHELTPSNDTNSSQDDEKIIPSIHDRYPDTESSTDDISQAVVPHLPSPDQDEDHHQMPQIPDFPGSYGSTATEEEDYPEEDQPFGPGTCRYGGKVYVSAQQIPRDDPCDFCFCFRSDIICLQQSCPPPIQHCHEEPISGFCCPRYECPVSMATVLNVTTTTTTTTTTLPPHFLSHAYKGAAQRQGCQIKGQAYKVGEVVQSASGPCLHCTCGGDGQMKCDPKVCTPEPMLRQMIAVAATTRRR